MAEYSREQRNQFSRAVANSELGSKQLKGFVDNRSNVCGRINTIKAFPNKKCPIQRFVIEEGNRKILSTTKSESGKIAEVEKGRSTYIEFSNSYQGYLVEAAKAIIGGRQRITSFDYLNKMIEKESESDAKSPVGINYSERRRKWREHSTNYYIVINVLRGCLSKINPLTSLEKRAFSVDSTLYLKYAGIDAVGAAIFLLNGENPEKKDTYVNEINSRLEEMELEKLVCEIQSTNPCSLKPPYTRDELNHNLSNGGDESNDKCYWGDDCGFFANTGELYFGLPYIAYSGCEVPHGAKVRAADRDVTGYSYHAWNELTRDGLTGGGVATVETCAGKGGILRAVFNIRPTTGDGIGNDIEILNQQGEEHGKYGRRVNELDRTAEKGVDISASNPQKTSCC